MVTGRTVSIENARDPPTRVIRVQEQVYERLNELRLTKYGKKSFTIVLADLLLRDEKREKQQ